LITLNHYTTTEQLLIALYALRSIIDGILRKLPPNPKEEINLDDNDDPSDDTNGPPDGGNGNADNGNADNGNGGGWFGGRIGNGSGDGNFGVAASLGPIATLHNIYAGGYDPVWETWDNEFDGYDLTQL
jgi:hypothetical protein